MNAREFAEKWYGGYPENEAEEAELRINGLEIYAKAWRLSLQGDIADWFQNSGIDEFTPQQVAEIICKWRPE